MDDSNTCTVATEAYYAPKSPYKLISESALEKRKQLYIGPDKETGGRTIRRYSDNFIVGRATCIDGLYVVQLAPKPQYIAHASTAKRQISQTTEAARQSTASSLLADKGSMIPTIAKGGQDVDSDNRGVYQID